MEITAMTFITLGCLIILDLVFLGWILVNLDKHDKTKYSTLNKPLKNKNKFWYNS